MDAIRTRIVCTPSMRSMRRLLAVAMGSLIVLGAARPTAADDVIEELQIVTKVRLAADHIEYNGIITAEANAGVFDLYEEAEPRPRTLVIESQGGSAGAAMELGAWILAKGLDVQVDWSCFSSCANYVFLAGQAKILAPRASLMWHGGVTQPISQEQLEQLLDYTLGDLNEQERLRVVPAQLARRAAAAIAAGPRGTDRARDGLLSGPRR